MGLDVHKNTITVAVAKWGRNEAEVIGTIPNAPQALSKLLRRLGKPVNQLHFCYLSWSLWLCHSTATDQGWGQV